MVSDVVTVQQSEWVSVNLFILGSLLLLELSLVNILLVAALYGGDPVKLMKDG